VSENEVLKKIIEGLEDLVKKSGGTTSRNKTPATAAVMGAAAGVNVDEKGEKKKSEIHWEQFKKILGVSGEYYEYSENFILTYFENLEKSLKNVMGDFFNKSNTTKTTSDFENFEKSLRNIIGDLADKINPKKTASQKTTEYSLFESIEEWLALGFDTLTEVSENILKTLKDIKSVAIQKFDQLISVSSKTSGNQKGSAGGSIFSNMVGFAAFAAGVYIIVYAMSLASDIKVDGVIKATIAIGIFMFAFLKFAKIQSDLKSASISFALFSATILFLILPLLYAFAAMPVSQFLNAVVKLAVIFTGLIIVVNLLSKVKSNDLRDSSVSFGILSLVISFIILPMLILAARMPWLTFTMGLFKLAGIIIAIYGLIALMKTIKPNDVMKSSLGLGVFGLVVGIILLPMLKSIYETPWMEILESIIKMGSIIGAVVGLIYLIGKIPQQQLLFGSITIGLISIVLFALSFALRQYADLEWGKIMVGIIASMATVGVFGLALAAIGALVMNPIVATILAIGGSVIVGMSFILIMLSLAMKSMSGDYDWKLIQQNMVQSSIAILKFGALMGIVGFVLLLAAPFIAVASVVIIPLLIIMGLMAVGLKSFSGEYDWALINENLIKSVATIASFGILMAGLGILMAFALPFIIIAGVAIVPLLILMNLIAVGIKSFSEGFDWEKINENIDKSYDTFKHFGWLLTKLGFMLGLAMPFILASAVPIGIMMGLMSTIANGIEAFSVGFDWENVRINIEESRLALIDFMKLISFLSEGFLGKMFDLIKAGPILNRMLELMSNLAEGIKVFNGVDGANLASVGMGLASLGLGVFTYIKSILDLKKFDNSLIDNLVNGINRFNILDPIQLSFIGMGLSKLGMGIRFFFAGLYSKSTSILDVVKNFALIKFLKSFEDINGAKLEQLGIALSMFSMGLIDLSSNAINFDNLISQIKNVIIPLTGFTFVLDKFNKVYSDFGRVASEMGLDQKIKMSFDNQNTIQEKLLELQKQEIDIQNWQLAQLQENGKLLQIIADKVSGGAGSIINAGDNSSGTTIVSPVFNTKQNWLGALNSTAMAMSQS